LLSRSTRYVQCAEHRHPLWSDDFVHDQTIEGRALKWLTVVDAFTREDLTIRYTPEPDGHRCRLDTQRVDQTTWPAELLKER
jgi:transposase InsO family protein